MVNHGIQMINILPIVDADDSPPRSVFTAPHLANRILLAIELPRVRVQIYFQSFWKIGFGASNCRATRVARVYEDDEIFHE